MQNCGSPAGRLLTRQVVFAPGKFIDERGNLGRELRGIMSFVRIKSIPPAFLNISEPEKIVALLQVVPRSEQDRVSLRRRAVGLESRRSIQWMPCQVVFIRCHGLPNEDRLDVKFR